MSVPPEAAAMYELIANSESERLIAEAAGEDYAPPPEVGRLTTALPWLRESVLAAIASRERQP